MKMLTMRDLNRGTARVLDAVERGEVFELRRNGKTIGYITRVQPADQRRPDWESHFDWLRQNTSRQDARSLAEFENSRRRHVAREREMESLG